jgi:hypothetical protein
MRRRLSIAMVVCLGISVASLAGTLAAQEKKEDKDKDKDTAKLERVEGNVHMIDKATKTVTVTLRGKTSTREVVYGDKTMFTFRNKAGTVDEVQDGRHVICLGKTNDKNQLVAARIDVRDKM